MARLLGMLVGLVLGGALISMPLGLLGPFVTSWATVKVMFLLLPSVGCIAGAFIGYRRGAARDAARAAERSGVRSALLGVAGAVVGMFAFSALGVAFALLWTYVSGVLGSGPTWRGFWDIWVGAQLGGGAVGLVVGYAVAR